MRKTHTNSNQAKGRNTQRERKNGRLITPLVSSNQTTPDRHGLTGNDCKVNATTSKQLEETQVQSNGLRLVDNKSNGFKLVDNKCLRHTGQSMTRAMHVQHTDLRTNLCESPVLHVITGQRKPLAWTNNQAWGFKISWWTNNQAWGLKSVGEQITWHGV